MTGDSICSAAGAAERLLAALQAGESAAVVTVVGGPSPDVLGRRVVVTAVEREGSLGSADIDETAEALARQALESQARRLHEVETDAGRWELYVEAQRPAPELVIVGAGHIARPLCRLGDMLGFRVAVIDDRPEYASPEWFPQADRVLVVDFADPFRDIEIDADTHIVLVTRAHRYDYDCIRQLLVRGARPAYLGMIGSRRRVRAAFEALVAEEGIEPARLEDVRAPIGLDIGAETPAEIALAIMAEIVALRRGGDAAGLTEEERVLRRVAHKRQAKKGGD